jgi:serine/threonine protein kinase
MSWEGVKHWENISINTLPVCNIKGELYDTSGIFICKFKPVKSLGAGTFGHVDEFQRQSADGSSRFVAIKRPKFPEMKLFKEALFQRKLHEDLVPYGLTSCVPEVYDIFRYQTTNDVWFTMEAFEPLLVSQWCIKTLLLPDKKNYMILLLLQIALILEVFEMELKIDHRDLKMNNMIVVDEKTRIEIKWKNMDKVIHFPFRIVFLDFGYACKGGEIDMKDSVDFPHLDACPKEGRDIFQVLVSLWNIQILRNHLEGAWGHWIRERISAVVPKTPCVSLVENTVNIDWMYTLTDNSEFRAPLCAPRKIIRDCMKMLEGLGVVQSAAFISEV